MDLLTLIFMCVRTQTPIFSPRNRIFRLQFSILTNATPFFYLVNQNCHCLYHGEKHEWQECTHLHHTMIYFSSTQMIMIKIQILKSVIVLHSVYCHKRIIIRTRADNSRIQPDVLSLLSGLCSTVWMPLLWMAFSSLECNTGCVSTLQNLSVTSQKAYVFKLVLVKRVYINTQTHSL